MKKTSSYEKYQAKIIEPKWQAEWERSGIYQPDIKTAKKPFYNLMMFPYPSAEGLHVGGVFTFGGVDAYGRFKRMQGYDVLEPFGLDGFGIHSENFAIKKGTHPMDNAEAAEQNFYRQIKSSGIGIDWSRTVETWKPNYYQWTQWLFTELFKAGLAYRSKAAVNFCPSCKTVLADEQVIDGKCERCSSVVEKRNLEQWFFRTTSYADRLLANLVKIDWPEKIKVAQRQWIGKKEGANINYQIVGSEEKISVFTTRPDTNFGASFIALAPEHTLVQSITTKENRKAVEEYIKITQNKSESDRAMQGEEKTGVFTGAYALNPLTGKKMPIWISDFVLGGFGTGALVGVPAHDKRDFAFAKKFNLEIIRVVVGKDLSTDEVKTSEQVEEGEGTIVNSDFLNGLDSQSAKETIIDYLQKKGWGIRNINYHLRDWLISRQRYWGPPIPMVYCETCARNNKSWFDTVEGKNHKKIVKPLPGEAAGWYPVDDLPVLLPKIQDYKPLGTGKAPLANYPEFYETTCPSCGSKAIRETDVSDNFLDSGWYFFRYPSSDVDSGAFDIDRTKKWLPVNIYIGGSEHSVLHLLYARFLTMFLQDLNYIDFDEPFPKFYAHGLILKDGGKMSKSKGNVINPDDYIAKYGADTLRIYLQFLGPFNEGGDFRDTGVEAMNRFLKRVWTLFTTKSLLDSSPDVAAKTIMHQSIKGITLDMEKLRFNTAIAKLMTWYNFLSKQAEFTHTEARTFLQLLAPFAPFMTEELWARIEENFSIHTSKWPTFDESLLIEDHVAIAIQVNGKLRGVLEVKKEDAEAKEMIIEKAKKEDKIASYLRNKTIKQTFFVPGKVVNFVIS